MKTNIFLFTFNRPDLLKNQVHSIRKNFVGDHSITVVHDSRGDDFVAEFTEEADRLNVEYVHYESFPGRSPSQYHADTINKAYENLIKDDCSGEIALLLDHDMFLIDELIYQKQWNLWTYLGVCRIEIMFDTFGLVCLHLKWIL